MRYYNAPKWITATGWVNANYLRIEKDVETIIQPTKRYFVRTGDFLATNGLEINSLKSKYFNDIERLYVNPRGEYLYFETQYLSKDKCNEIINRLSEDNLYASVLEE